VSVEVCNYRLTLRGKPVGTHVIKTEEAGRVRRMEAQSLFQGALGSSRVLQRSRSSVGEHHSLDFREETQERSEKRTFEVDFDADSGLVRASKGPKDRSEIPYLRPYRDPLSMLAEVRRLGDSGATEIAMLGKDVVVQFLGAVDLNTALGDKRANAYLLHPGNSVVYVDSQAPHAILKLTQRLPDGHLDALIVSIASEATLEGFAADDRPQERGSKSGRRRRGRRRQKRRGRN